jgi:AAA domain
MLIDANQLDTSPPEWLVDGMIPRVGVGFWYGPRYTGKSLAVDVELALAVANGVPFFGRETVQGTAIVGLGEGLYDAGVRKQARLAREQQDRIAYAAQISVAHGEDVAKAWLDQQKPYTDDNLKYLTTPFTVPVTRMYGEGDITPSMQGFINRAARYPDLELVVLDSISDFTAGLSISNDTSANRTMLGLKWLARELDCCILCVAHPTERGDKMLGAGRLGNAADFVIASRPEDSKTKSGEDVSSVTCEKNKYGGRFTPFSYRVEKCAWNEPVLDYQDNPTDETVLVTSATIRAMDDDEHELRPMKKKLPLPAIQRIESGPRKRNGMLRKVR